VNEIDRRNDYDQDRTKEAVMRFSRIIMSVVLFVLGSPAFAAQKPSAADLKAVQSCLAGLDGELGVKCIGIIADPCIKPALGKNDDVKVTNACAARELAVWEVQLQDAMKSVGSGGITKPVGEAQKAWLASREKLCPVFDKIEPGFLFGAANYCRLQETARRVLLLRLLGEAVNPH
jgi:uncharacterized protein YecT (DUF1311 family)